MATVSVSYRWTITPPNPKKVYRVWHNGLIVGEYENREGAEFLKQMINDNPDIDIIYQLKEIIYNESKH